MIRRIEWIEMRPLGVSRKFQYIGVLERVHAWKFQWPASNSMFSMGQRQRRRRQRKRTSKNVNSTQCISHFASVLLHTVALFKTVCRFSFLLSSSLLLPYVSDFFFSLFLPVFRPICMLFHVVIHSYVKQKRNGQTTTPPSPPINIKIKNKNGWNTKSEHKTQQQRIRRRRRRRSKRREQHHINQRHQ